MDVRYIQQDGVVFLTLSVIKATHVSPVWLGMRGGSAAECYMNSILDKKNFLNISNPLNTMEIQYFISLTVYIISLSTLHDKKIL